MEGLLLLQNNGTRKMLAQDRPSALARADRFAVIGSPIVV
jgi:hypothetical protein